MTSVLQKFSLAIAHTDILARASPRDVIYLSLISDLAIYVWASSSLFIYFSGFSDPSSCNFHSQEKASSIVRHLGSLLPSHTPYLLHVALPFTHTISAARVASPVLHPFMRRPIFCVRPFLEVNSEVTAAGNPSRTEPPWLAETFLGRRMMYIVRSIYLIY